MSVAIPIEVPITLMLTHDEARLLVDALDSHIYWQLSEEKYRDSGAVEDPGSDDEEDAAEIRRAGALLEKIELLTPSHPEDK